MRIEVSNPPKATATRSGAVTRGAMLTTTFKHQLRLKVTPKATATRSGAVTRGATLTTRLKHQLSAAPKLATPAPQAWGVSSCRPEFTLRARNLTAGCALACDASAASLGPPNLRRQRHKPGGWRSEQLSAAPKLATPAPQAWGVSSCRPEFTLRARNLTAGCALACDASAASLGPPNLRRQRR